MTSSIRSVGGYALVNPAHQTSVRNTFGYALVRRASDPLPIREVPSDLRKEQRQLLYDLIEESNPGFQALFPLDKLDFSSPVNKAVVAGDPYKRDTTVTVSAKAGAGFMGNRLISYRRIDLSVLFKNMLVSLNGYTAGVNIPKAQWVAELNYRYGLKLLEADNGNLALPDGTVYGISFTGLCYKGAMQLQWIKGKRPVLDLIPDAKQVLVGRAFPAGNDFSSPTRKPVGEWETYGIDCSYLSAQLDAFAASTVMAAGLVSASLTTLLDFLNNKTGRTNWSNQASTVEGGTCSLTWYKYTLPSASVPEANSSRFNRCIVIQGVAGSWFSGKILLHYNV